MKSPSKLKQSRRTHYSVEGLREIDIDRKKRIYYGSINKYRYFRRKRLFYDNYLVFCATYKKQKRLKPALISGRRTWENLRSISFYDERAGTFYIAKPYTCPHNA